MTEIEWNDNLALGIPELDRQHRDLAELIARIAAAAGTATERSDPAVPALLDKLYRETQAHFKQEETMMAATQYQGAAEHRREHTMLLAELKSWTHQVREGHASVRTQELIALKRWLVAHIVGPDRTFAKAYLAQPRRHRQTRQYAAG